MALVPCPECQKEVSTEAIACPQCAFPNPGKNPCSPDKSFAHLQACPGCGHSVSKQDAVCRFCGISLLGDRNGHSVAEEKGEVEETWLCPHCGTPYTRRVKRNAVALEGSTDKSPSISRTPSLPKSPQLDKQHGLALPGSSIGPLPRRRPALWQESLKIEKGMDSAVPRFPRSRKKSILLALLGILLIMVAGGLGALWQFKGITPMELFNYLQM